MKAQSNILSRLGMNMHLQSKLVEAGLKTHLRVWRVQSFLRSLIMVYTIDVSTLNPLFSSWQLLVMILFSHEWICNSCIFMLFQAGWIVLHLVSQ
jgi:hypothetical protein